MALTLDFFYIFLHKSPENPVFTILNHFLQTGFFIQICPQNVLWQKKKKKKKKKAYLPTLTFWVCYRKQASFFVRPYKNAWVKQYYSSTIIPFYSTILKLTHFSYWVITLSHQQAYPPPLYDKTTNTSLFHSRKLTNRALTITLKLRTIEFFFFSKTP